ncbi:MAG: rRNA maturation RNase YbeY [Phototrophicales bacterium]
MEILNEHGFAVDEALLLRAVQTVLKLQSAPVDSMLTIVITDNEEVAALNQQFRGIAAPTDVLSFPADLPPIPIEDEPPYLGDLVIAYPYALAQAEREKHDPQHSFALLVVHGTLHLLGFDHDTPQNRAQMWAAQDQALKALDIPLSIVPALEQDDAQDH